MSEKVILVLVDGMRPDGMLACGHPFVNTLLENSTYSLDAQTVWPSMTLPCHTSLFYGVEPIYHGITTNTFTFLPKPIPSLFDQLEKFKKKCAMFYTWEELRDMCRPGALHHSTLVNIYTNEHSDTRVTDEAIPYIQKEQPDFLFLYMGEVDTYGGHDFGWMGKEYLAYIHGAIANIERVYNALPEGYTLIVMADHGGHDRYHGHNIPEDMTIPVVFCGPKFEKNKAISGASIKDIAPTVAKLLDVPAAKEWEGTTLV